LVSIKLGFDTTIPTLDANDLGSNAVSSKLVVVYIEDIAHLIASNSIIRCLTVDNILNDMCISGQLFIHLLDNLWSGVENEDVYVTTSSGFTFFIGPVDKHLVSLVCYGLIVRHLCALGNISGQFGMWLRRVSTGSIFNHFSIVTALTSFATNPGFLSSSISDGGMTKYTYFSKSSSLPVGIAKR